MDSGYADRYEEFERTHWWFAARRRVLDSVLRRHVGGGNGAVLDVGCGPGGSRRLLGRYGRMTGVDLRPRALEIARRGGYETVLVSRIEEMGLRSQAFDTVVALDVIEHVDDDAAVLGEMFRACRSGGMALISVPAYEFLWGPQDVVSHHKRRYSRRGLRQVVQAAGFQVVRLTYFNTFLFPVVAAVRLLQHVVSTDPAGEPRSDFEKAPWWLVSKTSEWIFSTERLIVPFVDLPFGVSILCLASKPA